MKKTAFYLIIGILYLTACSKNDKRSVDSVPVDNETATIKVRRCAAADVLKQQLLEDPSLGQRMAKIEKLTSEVIRNKSLFRLLPDGSIEIPVVVNVLYRTTAQNVSLAQVQSQINALNKD
ncbi:hypothetical protein CLV51_1011632 [Chitinophaga niastensis]|uniref:Uncharacterized protein n=1 Tax=Chitinophaga niastensis TaxID=536980 RepID=A0A2P8HVT0_CHINA|nr:hypothetical protein [Chitinophaga niastensis]PSL50288.1 hypothetical protein CLV51_1011632 [Chitinophaga niastensis]